MFATLNPEQRMAVEHCEGPAFILAGPGTGKTLILQERTVCLVSQGVHPGAIAVLTFTRKAADDNRRRITTRLSPESADQVQVSTLHSLALRILVAVERKHHREVPDVVDPVICFNYLRRALTELELDPALYTPFAIWKTMIGWKASGRNLATLEAPVRQVVERYQKILSAERRWDLADLVVNATVALQTESDIAAAFQSVRFLMVDEFQDTSLAEYDFLQAVLGSNRNLFCVGAAAQSIYTWRGADARALMARYDEDYPEARRIILRRNYRSGSSIIAAAAAMAPEEREVYLSSENGPGQVILKECTNNLAEATLVASLIRELAGRDGLAYTHFAVLFRSWAQAPPIEQALSDQHIPYVLYGDQAHYYERPEVRSLFAYLRAILVVAGEPEASSLDGALDLILAAPPRGVGPRSLALIRGRSPEVTWELLVEATLRTDLREQVRQAVRELFELLSRLSRLVEELSPAEMIARIIRETGWELALQDELEGKKMLANLRAFQAEAGGYAGLEGFVSAMKNRIKSDLAGKGVAVSTIHAAKGLEWPVVFVIGLNQGSLPSAQSLRTAENGDPVEERHVAHVAFSRARELLFLTWNREIPDASGFARSLRPSDFLGRLPREEVHEYETVGDLRRLTPPRDPGDLEPGGEDGFEEND